MKNTHELSNGEKLLTIGDPHLGRRFTTNVPLEARGVREQQLRDKYIELLNTPDVQYICMMGDLFDKFDVPNEVILFAWRELEKAAKANPETFYIFNRGNHDESRDTDLKSSWSVFEELSNKAGVPNVLVAGDAPGIVNNKIGYVPWHPFKDPDEQVTILLHDLVRAGMEGACEYVLTHNDVSTYGSDGEHSNLMAFDKLVHLEAVVLNGHVHQAGEFTTDAGLKVVNTGSMMPLNFAEDKSGEMFVTLTLEEFEAADASTLEGKSVRVLLKPDEEAPDPIKCLQFKVKRISETGTEEVGEVKPEDFELKALYDDSMQDVADPLKEEIWESIKDKL